MIRALARGLAVLVAVAGSGAAQPAATDTTEGSSLSVYLMTMGPGDQIWERFGHNAIGVRDSRDSSEVVYNWGVFSFTDRDFLPRFLRGEMRYSVEPFAYGPTIAHYERINRQVEIQELNLTPAQRVALRDFVQWNALEANKFYHYDYFGDNCSTRVRDVLDRVLGGALQRQFGGTASGRTFRDEARRLSERDLLYPGIDIGLGAPSDRVMTRWEAMFVPMTVRDLLREVTVDAVDGTPVPLVSSERVVFAATREPEPTRATNRQLPFFVSGLLMALLIVGVARWSPGTGRALAGSWCMLAGAIGLLLVALWGFTSHIWAYRNVNLLFFSPLWFWLAWRLFRRPTLSGWSRRVVLGIGALVIVGLLLALVRWPQASEQVALLAAPPHLAVLLMLLRPKSDS